MTVTRRVGLLLCLVAMLTGCPSVVPVGTQNTGCVPKSCSAERRECGDLDDGCGHTLACGSCSGADTCGGSGQDGICGAPQCNAAGWCWVTPMPVGQNLRGVFAVARDDAWTVGGNGQTDGVIARWDGLGWRNVTPRLLPGVTGVWASRRDDAWFSLVDGSVVHFDGTTWTSTQVAPFGLPLNAIAGSAADDVWVVANAFIARFDGQQWAEQQLPLSRSI